MACGDGRCDDGEECDADCGGPVCGDGELGDSEACDDGNVDDGDGCESDCTVTPNWSCGDGVCGQGENGNNCYTDCGACGNNVREGDEECDEGAYNVDNGVCRPGCIKGVCGDGVNIPGVESCDDGNLDDADGCHNDCTWNCVCGDGVKCALEECDHGNGNGFADGCKPDCTLNVCGDGMLWEGVEQCDDGNLVDIDNCSVDCDAPRYVFVTSMWTSGGNIGGLEGADQHCMGLAAAGDPVVKSRKFRAWLSGAQDSESPWARIRDPDFSGWYKLVDGTLVARGWSGLIDGQGDVLDHEIIVTEKRVKSSGASVWTNTDRYGKPATTILHCNGWTSSSAQLNGYVGLAGVGVRSVEWTYREPSTCGSGKRLYCFEFAE